jgi:DNA-binding transcriptional MerR regulator
VRDAAIALPSLLSMAAGESSDPKAPSEYTIDELAAVTRVPSRTIRFYQSRGALMAPELRGRVAYYGTAHIERLKLIARLQDRGLRMDAIRDVVTSIDRGELDLPELLGIEQQVQTPWVNDQARTVSEAELIELVGVERPGLIADLVRAQLIERRGEVYLVGSPALLQVIMKLDAVGIDLQTAVAAGEVVRKHIGRAVQDLVGLFVKRAGEGFIEIREPIKLLQALRPTGIEAVRIIFGREMERALRKLVESGELAKIGSRNRKAKRR